MKFFLSRTSTHGDEKPCEEAVQGTYTRIDRRTVDDPLKIGIWKDNPERAQREWYGEGTNHRVENGLITRDFPGEKAWFIKIGTLEQLITLQKKYGSLILSEALFADAPAIEIYDDHRE